MSDKIPLLVRIDPKLHKALGKIRDKTGDSMAKQVGQALKGWVESEKARAEYLKSLPRA